MKILKKLDSGSLLFIVEYSTPLKIVEPLIKEFSLTRDVCASALNHKLPIYWTKEDNSLAMNWEGNCWMNPPFIGSGFIN
jgi:hypothetical protein